MCHPEGAISVKKLLMGSAYKNADALSEASTLLLTRTGDIFFVVHSIVI